MSEFDGLVAIVTGGASGLGEATAALLAERGARVAVLDRSTEGVPSGYLAVECDITSTEQVNAAVQAACALAWALEPPEVIVPPGSLAAPT